MDALIGYQIRPHASQTINTNASDNYSHYSNYLLLPHQMAPKPVSTASKAPASTAASKAPAKTTDKAKKATKTSAAAAAAGADGEKKKRRKVRKETYSSYIYKGMYL